MALIVEVLEPRGGKVRTRVRLDVLPMSIGRAYDNDIILDDVYVDARHARISMSDDGIVHVEDLGSINGLVRVDGRERVPRVAVHAGMQVRLGHTILRFRDPAEPVAPAVRDAESELPYFARLLDNGWGRVAICVAATAMVTLYTWLSSYERDSVSTAVAVAVVFVVTGVMWSACWAIASRVALNRFNFVGHFTLFSAFTVPLLLFVAVAAWVLFMFPDNTVSPAIGVAVWLAGSTASIALHLRLASSMSRARRWRAGAITTAVLALTFGLLAYAGSEIYSDVPAFSGVLKPISGSMLLSIEVSDFSDVVAELTAEADALVDD